MGGVVGPAGGNDECAVEGGKKEVDQTTLGFFASIVSQA
jgi:hypothetical protein